MLACAAIGGVAAALLAGGVSGELVSRYAYADRTSAITAAGTSTAACVLLMTHAFESWRVHRLTLKTDARNLRSRAAILRLGGQFEGILRAHLPAADGQIRDTAMFSVVRSEWPGLKPRLEAELRRGHSGKEDAR